LYHLHTVLITNYEHPLQALAFGTVHWYANYGFIC